MNVALIRSRCTNVLRCYTNYLLSLIGLVRITHRPLFVSVESSSVCQLHCPECPVGMRNEAQEPAPNAPFISREVWLHVLREAAPYAHTIQFYFQGEPLLNKDLPTMVAEAHTAGLYTVVSTNAQVMTPELAESLVRAGLNRIIVSMDGLTDETYNAYRVGGSLEKCKEALRQLRAAKDSLNGRMVIELQCLRLRTNEHEWQQFRKEYKKLGADRLTFKTAQLYNYSHGHPLMPSNPLYRRYVKGEDGLFHRRSLGRGCLRAWSGVVVTTTGEVLPCCYDKRRTYSYGNILETSLAELFSNEKAIAFRQKALREEPDVCKECWK